ncbi:MAG TPA: ABC transporter substrate-binding protein [Candidatus Alectryocaccobium stercorigallinarum]|nr:ABC transporter substrate-binding protein [Candidatus Alectryocaccobium stercorigallinarum]
MKKRKLVSLVLAGALAISALAGCGGGSDDSSSASSGSSTTSESSASSEASTSESSESSSASSTSESSEAAGDAEYTKFTLATSIPLTGTMMQYGTSYQNGIEMAVADFNASGGLGGQDVVVQINDDMGDANEAINVANKIISDSDVFAVVGSYGSTLSMAAAPVYEGASLPMVSPNTSHPDFPSMGKFLVPISPIADIERGAATEMIYELSDGGDLAILYQNTDLGVTGSEVMIERYEELGGTVVTTETFTPQQTKDFTPLLSKIKETNPAVLYIDGEYNDLANILIQIQQVGLDGVQIVGPGNAFKQEFLDIAGDAANGVILAGTTPVYLDSVMTEDSGLSEAIVDFTTRYNELYPDTPCDGFAASAYDAAMLAMLAAREAGTTDPQALMDAMLAIPDGFECVSGKDMSYEDYNYVVKGVFTYTVEDGEFKNYTM